MSKKSPRIAAFIEKHLGCAADAHYLGFFDAFNAQQYFEAHEVLEELWLAVRQEPSGDFYKGLIQLAGAFVHVQKKRLGPAAALLALAHRNLSRYGRVYEHLDVEQVLQLIEAWQARLQAGDGVPDFTSASAPQVSPSGGAFSHG
ncbi:MAG: DUF309 domain-containing protein [Verrucomicrobiia bacterium]